MKKKVLALTLSMALLLGSSSTIAFAAEDERVAETVKVEVNEITESPENTAASNEEEDAADEVEENAKLAVQGQTDDGISVQAGELASGTCGENLTWVLTVDGILTLSGEGEMQISEEPYSAPWYQYRENIQKAIIEDGITSVGKGAFSDCIALMEVEIPNSVTSIGESAFSNCRELVSIELPDSVANIGMSAFSECYKLENIILPDGITTISQSMFWRCTTLKEITIPDGVNTIEHGAFWMCYSLENVEIPNSVNKIEGFAFQSCAALKEIEIPDGVISIGEEAFYNTGLETVVIPKSVDNIDLAAFGGCSTLKSAIILNGNISLAPNIFAGCTSLTEISLPDNMARIDEYAFWGCSNLKEITIPASVTFIGTHAVGYVYEENESGIGEAVPVEGFTIHGYAGTAAETYANENSFTFVAITNPEIEIVPEKSDEVYVLGSGQDAVIYCTGEFAEFVSVEMDGVLVDPANYKVEDGSTILTFASSYLDTLSIGRHTVTLNYIDESISTYLTIVEKNAGGNTSTGGGAGTSEGNGTGRSANGIGSADGTRSGGAVKTGDQSDITLWTVFGLGSLAVCAVVIGSRKRSA